MPKRDLQTEVLNYNKEIQNALLTVYKVLNKGQRQKILKDPAVKALFDRYGVKYDAAE